ncbi:MAG: FAD-dependent oxidoreductase [Gemmatimonadota bacterium]
MKAGKLTLVFGVLTALALFFFLDLGQYLSLDYLKSQQAALDAFYQDNRALTMGAYAGIYVLVTALSVPGAAIMTLAGGAIFGLLWGTVLVSFASSVGATLAFLAARYLFRNPVQQRFGSRLKAINRGVEKDGPFYLFMLRLVPIFPFFVINLVMGLTPMRTLTYYLVSQIGMLPGTVVYVNAGTQLARIETAGGILSPGLIGAFVLLGIFPLLARWIAAWLKGRRALKGWTKPRTFDRNLVVIGAGSAGLVTSYIAAAVKAKVTLIEKHEMGGDCLNTGCVPSKALIRSARFASQVARHEEFGFKSAHAELDFAHVMERVQRVVKTIEPHDSVERYQGLGVEVIKGEARITGPWSVEVNGQTLTTRNIVVASGARPFVPPIPGLDDVVHHTSETIWSIRDRPSRLLVLGGGPIGCELTQAFQRLGSQVTQVEMLPRIMAVEDPDVSEFVEARFRAEGVDVRTGLKVVRFLREDGEQMAVAEDSEGKEFRIPFDVVLVAVGRQARVEGFGLDEVGVRLDERRRIATNRYLQTDVPTIYACGDCVGPYQFTHAASHQAWFTAVNSLFSNPLKRFAVDYKHLPWTTYTDPEVARVGLNESDAQEQGVDYEVSTYSLEELDRAIAEEEAHGFVKVLTPPGKDRILGVTLVGAHAGDLMAEFTLAMKHGLGLNKILGTIHAYPAFAEANKYVAGNWKRANAPEGVLRWVERYHSWRRG